MSTNLYSHPGYLYQITRENNDIQSVLKMAEGLKLPEQMLYVYLTPPLASSSSVNPFNNCRLKTIMNEVEVVAFDTPPEKEEGGPININNLGELLQKNYSKETLMRINDSLTESLKSRKVDMTQVDQKTGDDSEKLALAVALKMYVLMAKNLDLKLSSSDSTESTNNPVTPKEKLDPKQRIHRKAEEIGKSIEYIDERNFIEKYKELLFDKGFLEVLLCSFFTDQEFIQTMTLDIENKGEAWNTSTLQNTEDRKFHRLVEKHPAFIDLKKKFDDTNIEFDKICTLATKINTYLSSNKKTLLVLEGTPQTIKQLKPYISVSGDNYAEVKVKGPIKEPTGCFWKIKKNDATVGYLLGSIHITPNYLLDLNSRIRKCFEKSARLAVEIDITRENKAKQNFLKRKKKLWEEKYSTFTNKQIDHISSALKKLFPKESEKVDFSNKEEKSAFIFIGVSMLKSKIFTELKLSSGIDLQLIKQAKTNSKPVEDLETQEQYSQQKTTQEMIASNPMEDLFLHFLALEELQKIEKIDEVIKGIIEQLSLYHNEHLKPMFDAWEEGNLEAFDASQEDSTDKKIDMTQRNMNMAMKIVNLVNEKEKIFCCVGAAHTVGEMNVQAFLKNFGFSTERVFV